MVAFGKLKRGVLKAGRLALGNSVARKVTRRAGLQGRLHRRYWRRMHRAHDGTCSRELHGATVDFHAANPDEFRHYETLVGEREIIEDVLSHVEPGDVFYDVGACYGIYTCFVAANVPATRPVAFEPDPDKQDRLHRNVAANDLDADIREQVLSDATGTASLATSNGRVGRSAARVATNGQDGTIEVARTTGDELVEQEEVPPPNVVKVDVEGGEFDALRGMRDALGRSECRVVYCEVHPALLPAHDATEEDVRGFLAELGFDVTRVGERGEEYFLRAVK